MDAEEERRRKIEEGRRRLEKLKAKKESDKNAVHAAKKPLPSPFAAAARKPFPEFKLPQTCRKSSAGTPRELIADKGVAVSKESAVKEVVAANKENVHVKGDTQTPPQQQQQQQQQKNDYDSGVGVLLASDMQDAKAVEDQISRLRELDKSYTQPPHRDPAAKKLPPAIYTLEQQQQQQQQQLQQQTPDGAKLPDKKASQQILPEPAQLHEQEPAKGSSIVVNAQVPAAPTGYLSPSKLTGAPTGYLSPSKKTGAPHSIHFGTGLPTRNT